MHKFIMFGKNPQNRFELVFLNGQTRPLFVYFHSFRKTNRYSTNLTINFKVYMVCLGLEPRAAGWQAQTNLLSYLWQYSNRFRLLVSGFRHRFGWIFGARRSVGKLQFLCDKLVRWRSIKRYQIWKDESVSLTHSFSSSIFENISAKFWTARMM